MLSLRRKRGAHEWRKGGRYPKFEGEWIGGGRKRKIEPAKKKKKTKQPRKKPEGSFRLAERVQIRSHPKNSSLVTETCKTWVTTAPTGKT